MIRTKIGDPRRAGIRTAHLTRWRQAAARTPDSAVPGTFRGVRRLLPGRTGRRCPGRRRGRRLRDALATGLPTLWGAAAVTFKLTCPLARQDGLEARIATCLVLLAVGTGLVVHARRGLLRELRQVRRVAGAAQGVLLRPPPPRLEGLSFAAAQFSADRGATVGGDLYEVVGTEHGVRVVMGDVRGHGLAALGTVAAVLGSFREAAHDEAELPGVLRRLERALARHLGERAKSGHHPSGAAPGVEGAVAEEFVTVLLLEIGGDGTMRALNCGHPWPYLLRRGPVPAGAAGPVEQIAVADPLPPLGLFPLPAEPAVVRCGRLLPGEALFLHTDGAEDARDRGGRFFPLAAVLADAVLAEGVRADAVLTDTVLANAAPAGTVPTGAVRADTVRADAVPGRIASPQELLRTVSGRLRRHVGGRPPDNVAMLVIRNDRNRPTARPGPSMARHSTP
ncbi:PP2C family protein-serine/threonine phosphatase [Streptomyces fructofermentans]|uniref:PP2C family protein-serine/threonine phosphatase n=1 Tax=Streptomyces fructofermentans TaxID=152141 RepID=UPI00379AC306